MPTRPASIKTSALRWLAQREHSRSELRIKLLRLLARRAAPVAAAELEAADAVATPTPTPTTEVDAVLDWLECGGHLSQQRFIESRVHARQARFGNLRIRHELQQHGLSLDDATRQALQQTELQRAQDVWRKKFKQPAADAAGRLRQMRFLAGRGFSQEVVRQVLRGIATGEGEVNDACG